MDYRLLAYDAVDGIPTFSDSAIMHLFDRMEQEGLVDTVFYSGTVRDRLAFLGMMKGMNRLYVIELRGELAGFCWLNGFNHRRANFHFCFFSNLRGELAVEVGRWAFETLLNLPDKEGRPLFDLFTGLVDVENVPAMKWCAAMGLEQLGILPSAIWNARKGQSVSAAFWYAERGKYVWHIRQVIRQG